MINAFEFESDWIAAFATETGDLPKEIEKALHDGRVVRAAERLEPGCLRRIIDRAIARGEEPSHELLHRRLARLLRRHNFDVAFVRI